MRRLFTAAALAAAALGSAGRAAAQEPAGASVDSIEVAGVQRVTRETVVNTAAIPLHTPITYRDIQRAVRDLFALGQFDDVTVSRRVGDQNEEILVFAVRERPMVARTTVRGAVKLSERSVRDRIDVPVGRPLDPAQLAHSVQRIDSLYEQAGYYLAKVQTHLIPQGGDSGRVVVIFDVTEDRRVAIASVDIEGNQAFSDADIVHHMSSRPEGFWWFQQGEFSDSKLREDLDQKIPAFYTSHGYIDFRIVRDTLLVDDRNGKATLRIEVDEGRQYQVGTVTVDGNRFLPTSYVMSLNPFTGRGRSGLGCLLRHCGDSTAAVFDQGAWEDATQKLQTQYANEGYIYARIRPEIQRVESPDSSQPGIVNLTWLIDESQPAIINRIDIIGNDVTHERVIREALVILPGDVFAQDRILRSYQNISNLGFFQQPLPFPDTRPANDNGDIDLVFHVTEKHTGSVNFGASVGQGTGVGGFLGLEEPNLWGLGKRGKLQWQFGRYINDFSLSYTDPSLFGGRISGTGEIHNSRVRYTVADLGQITTRGTSLQFGFPLPHSRYSRLFVSGGLDWESYSGGTALLNSGSIQCKECFRTSLGAQVVRDTRIDLPFPTGGSLHQVGVTLNGPFHTGTASFQRFDLEGRWYTPVARLGGGPTVGGIKLVIGLTSKAGFVTGNVGPFFRQLFAMGGTQYGIPLRGYDEFAITPQGFNPSAGLSGVPRSAFGASYFASTAEFGARLTPQIYVSTFYDAGNVWASASGFNPTRLFRGAGFGVSLITPLGPLGLDLAYGFDRTDSAGRPAPGWKLHFKIGNFF